jgi:hypothetical protein
MNLVLHTEEDRVRFQSVRVIFVVHKVALAQAFLRILLFFTVSIFRQCCLLISIYKLLVPDGQMGEAWEPSKQQRFTQRWRTLDSKLLLYEDQREVTSTEAEWKRER